MFAPFQAIRLLFAISVVSVLFIANSSGVSASTSFTDVVAKARHAVVSLEITRADPCQLDSRKAVGSGFFFRADGLILTNHHVVDQAMTIEGVKSDGVRFTAEVIAVDRRSDLAILKAQTEAIHILPLGDVTPSLGAPVVAIGNPLGYGLSLTAGIVSGLDRPYSNSDPIAYIQHDAAINPGSSGGPLLDVHGRLIGINTAIPDDSRYNVGIGLAVPATLAHRVVADLLQFGQPRRSWIGLTLQDMDPALGKALKQPKTPGPVVIAAQKGTPATNSGLRIGDILLGVDGTPTPTRHAYALIMDKMPLGTALTISIVRNGNRIATSLKTVLAPPQRNTKWPRPRCKTSHTSTAADHRRDLGILFRHEIRTRGIPTPEEDGPATIDLVDLEGAGERAGLKPGDRILAVGQVPVANWRDARARIAATRTDSIALLIERPGDGRNYVVVSLKGEAATRLQGNIIRPARHD